MPLDGGRDALFIGRDVALFLDRGRIGELATSAYEVGQPKLVEGRRGAGWGRIASAKRRVTQRQSHRSCPACPSPCRGLSLDTGDGAIRHATYQLLRNIPGIGPINALTILAMAGDLRRFGHHRQFLKFCRLDLATCQSGTFCGRTKLSKYGNARQRRTSWMAAQVAARQRDNSFRDKLGRYTAGHADDADRRRKAMTALSLVLTQHADDLILGKMALPHRSSPSDELTTQWHDFRGARQPMSGEELKARVQSRRALAEEIVWRDGGVGVDGCNRPTGLLIFPSWIFRGLGHLLSHVG